MNGHLQNGTVNGIKHQSHSIQRFLARETNSTDLVQSWVQNHVTANAAATSTSQTAGSNGTTSRSQFLLWGRNRNSSNDSSLNKTNQPLPTVTSGQSTANKSNTLSNQSNGAINNSADQHNSGGTIFSGGAAASSASLTSTTQSLATSPKLPVAVRQFASVITGSSCLTNSANTSSVEVPSSFLFYQQLFFVNKLCTHLGIKEGC